MEWLEMGELPARGDCTVLSEESAVLETSAAPHSAKVNRESPQMCSITRCGVISKPSLCFAQAYCLFMAQITVPDVQTSTATSLLPF